MQGFTLLLSLLVHQLSQANNTVHVVLIIGQSNAIGFNMADDPPSNITNNNIQQLSCCDHGQVNNHECRIIQAQDPLHHVCWNLNSPRSEGFGMVFARELRTKIPQDDIIVIVPAAIQGTGFADHVWTAYTGIGFIQAQTRLAKAFELIEHMYSNYHNTLVGILWHQGEGDTNSNTSKESHLENNLKPMISAWRNTTLIPQTSEQVPFVVGNMVPEWLDQPWASNRRTIAAALQELSQHVAYSAVAPSFGLLPNDERDMIHFNAPSQRLLGKRYFVAWQAAFLNHKLVV